MLKRIGVAVLVLSLSACATSPGGGIVSFLLPEPDVVSANERYITLHDMVGLPGRVEQMASAHCSSHGRIAQFQSKGGNGWPCSGQGGLNLCSTYTCVQ